MGGQGIMTVTFDNLLDGSELHFKKEVFFEENTEIAEVTKAAEDILDKYDLYFVCFCFQGDWYLVPREK